MPQPAPLPFLEAVARGVVVYDGAMGTQLQARELTLADFGGKEGANDYLVLTRPDVVRDIHAGYFAAGADVVETNTFGGNRLKLEEYGLGHLTHELNATAARLAREAADAHATPDRPRFVAGSIGPTGMLPSSDDPALSAISFEQLAELFQEQAVALVEGGCDVLLVETSQDILEVKAAVAGIQRAFQALGRRVALQVQVTLDTSGRMLLGTDILSALATLQALPIDILGLNCSTGPEHMREPIRLLAQHCRLPISVLPNAGLPLNIDGRAVYPAEPIPFAEALEAFVVDFGVAVVGGCCGTTPDHIRVLAGRLAGRPHAPREVTPLTAVSSGMRAASLLQEPRPLLVGERLNAQGSRKVKQLLLAEDQDGLVEVARDQVEGGAHVLDVCVALTERADEVEMMRAVVKKLALSVEAPLVFDSTEPAVLLEALRVYPGRAIINSINLENGRERCDAVLPMAVEHGAAVIALTIDPVGMAKTAARKLEVARAIHAIACGEYGLPPEALLFDALTFTLATGEEEFRRSAIETIEGIRRIKAELPGVLTVLGVSNVSFGLTPAARHVLNSVFLYHCVAAGLDAAIVNPAHLKPFAEIPADQRELAEDLVFDRRPDALPRFIAHFEGVSASAGVAEKEDPTAGMDAEAAVHWKILHRKKDGIEALLDEALTRRSPVQVLNEVLLPAMKDVGDRFGAGELILPFVLQSAEVMKKAVAHVEQFLEKAEGVTKGKVVLATVYGDVHDIGKNLVNTILTNNGYTVYDLGKQVPVNTILDKAVEVDADVIGLSALLVSTSKQMPACLAELDRRGLKLPVIIGGAAINKSYGLRILTLEDGRWYEPGVFYANDAFEGLSLVDQLVDPERRETLIARTREEATAARVRPRKVVAPAAPGTRSAVPPASVLPPAPFLGHRVVQDVPLSRVFDGMDLRSLYRLSWGARNTHGEAYEALIRDEFEPRRLALQAEAAREGWLAPRFVYGYFPAQAEGDRIHLYDPADPGRRLGSFECPRQPEGEHLCLADYVAEAGSGRMDVVALQVVTVGTEAAELCERLNREGRYGEAYWIHGLSVEAAEGLAEVAHQHIRQEWGIGPGQGKRYSWGYPAIPELGDHALVWRALPVEDAIGVSLTEAFQLVPEQSTAAIVLHHPEAKYFVVRGAAGAVAVY
ncbi:MAG: methionine synthase [Candidatus Sericytochromatia bacterium]|nr:methionine synthase [Candidatus Sericytochromatia bacterium]